MQKRKVLFTLLLALALLGLAWVGTVAASAASLGLSDGEIEIWGVIQAVGTDHIVVNGLTVVVDETTEIKEADQDLELADLEVDWTVKVEGFLSADGTILAKEIKVISREPVTPTPPVTIAVSPLGSSERS